MGFRGSRVQIPASRPTSLPLYRSRTATAAWSSRDATREDLARLDRKRPKKGSNQDWKSPSDPDAKITKMKDGDWRGKSAEKQAVYSNRRRIRSRRGKQLMRLRGERVERSFAHCYETGEMPRTHFRDHAQYSQATLDSCSWVQRCGQPVKCLLNSCVLTAHRLAKRISPRAAKAGLSQGQRKRLAL